MKLFNKLVKPLCFCKARKIAHHCGSFVKGEVLDVGAGRCIIAREIKKQLNVNVSCIDVVDHNETEMKLTIYDGKKIPFKENNFNTVMLVYVLHHCDDPISVLKECLRVCKKNGRLIIFEDFGFIFFTYLLDWISNKLHNVEAPLNFKKYDEWKNIFTGLNMEIEHVEDGVERQFFYPFVNHKMFVLRVKK